MTCRLYTDADMCLQFDLGVRDGQQKTENEVLLLGLLLSCLESLCFTVIKKNDI